LVNKRFSIIRCEQGSGPVADRQRKQVTIVSPTKEFAQILAGGQIKHGAMATGEKHGDLRAVVN
jgi:hypothetical protein